jgi:hypothetical protein
MSYCKRGLDGSDVYLYPTGVGEVSPEAPIVCQCCDLQPSGDYLAYSRSSALEHLAEHQHAGHSVPAAAVDRLERELAAERNRPP